MHQETTNVRWLNAMRIGASVAKLKHCGWSFRPLVLASVVALLFLTGCGSESPYLISKGILLAVLGTIKRNRKLQFSDTEELEEGERRKTPIELKEDRQKAWFIFHRAELIGKRHDDWDEDEITPRVDAQFGRILSYLDTKLGAAGNLRGYAEPNGSSPAGNQEAFTSSPTFHLDLANLAITFVGGESTGLEDIYLNDRHTAVRSIVWHAAGLHDAVWSEGGDGAVLNVDALNELLDRRLRVVERMRWQVNAPFTEPPTNPNHNPRGPWFDKSRVRVFEYPYFPRSFVNPADIWNPSLGTPQRHHIWIDFDPETVQYTWRGDVGEMTRFAGEPDQVSTTWTPTFNGSPAFYAREPGPGNLADAMDELFRSNIDIWNRTWLFCDHSIAAMHLEALRFALARRPGAPSFDSLVRPKHPFLAGILGGTVFVNSKPVSIDDNQLWSDGVQAPSGDTLGTFDNLYADFRHVQVGDHVILWNHHLYVFVTTGAWRLENSILFDIDIVTDNWDEDDEDIDPAIFMKPRRDKMRLDGFGCNREATENYTNFLAELFDGFRDDFLAVYSKIPATGDFFQLTAAAEKSIVVRWNPYSTGIDPGLTRGAWFIFLGRVASGDTESPYPNKTKMLEIIKHSVIDGPNRGSNYVPPPTGLTFLLPGESTLRSFQDGVFFPLFLPEVKGRQMSWAEYFEKRAADSSLEAELRPIELAPEMMPGLFVRGEDQPMEVVRPRARA